MILNAFVLLMSAFLFSLFFFFFFEIYNLHQMQKKNRKEKKKGKNISQNRTTLKL